LSNALRFLRWRDPKDAVQSSASFENVWSLPGPTLPLAIHRMWFAESKSIRAGPSFIWRKEPVSSEFQPPFTMPRIGQSLATCVGQATPCAVKMKIKTNPKITYEYR
jgi:hypothetical protein